MIYDNRELCINCFVDSFLKKLIEENGRIGTCYWCGSENVKTVPVFELSDIFRAVAECYDEITGPSAYLNGETISYRLQEDWNIFSDNIDPDLIQEISVAIMYADIEPKERDDYPDYNGFFVWEMPDLEFEWFDKLETLINLNKSQQESEKIDASDDLPDRIELAIEDRTSVLKAGRCFWRARIHKDRNRKTRFTPSEMGAPPPNVATAGRANKANEPVLYLATDYQTALAEVRSWRGMSVAVAQIRLKQDIRILDLIKLSFPESPFESEYLCYDLQVLGLLQSFSSALSLPLLPNEEKKLYIPSQSLCKFIKQRGVEGILYPSSMGSGNNLVIFNPDQGEPTFVQYYRIGTPNFSPELIDDMDDIYEYWPYAYLVD